MLISGLLHGAATVVLGLIMVAPPIDEAIELEFLTLRKNSDDPVRMEFVEASPAAESPAAAEAVDVDIPGAEQSAVASAAPAPGMGQPLVTFEAVDFGPLEELPAGGGQGSGTGRQRRLTGASYYGIEASGNRFVYIVDASSSMSGQRWNSAQSELVRSIESLPAAAEFYVLFFSHETTLMFGERPEDAAPMRAVDVSSQRLRRWIRSVRLGRTTLPLPSVQLALKMDPDAIFLLTDGEFKDATAHYIRSAAAVTNESLPPIHTIGLFSRAGRGTLRGIAMATGGDTRFVAKR